MSSFNASFPAIAALALILGVVLYALLASAWRILHDDGRLRLERMLKRNGASLGAALGTSGYQAAIATRRCVACADKAECDAWLRSGGRGSIPKFCPNADFIEHATNTR